MQSTTNYGLNIVEGTDIVNPLTQFNPNFTDIDTILKSIADASVDHATCIKTGTVHAVTRTNTDANVFRFTATGNWNTGDTMTVDGTLVSVFNTDGTAPSNGCFVINTEVIAAIQGTRVTLYTSVSNASGIAFDNTGTQLTGSDVQSALEELDTGVESALTPSVVTSGFTPASNVTVVGFKAAKQGGFITISAVLQPVISNYGSVVLGTLPSGYVPTSRVDGVAGNMTKDTQINFSIQSNGEISVFATNSNVDLAAQNISLSVVFV